ncbi:MAG: hypothetical protein K6G48_06885 [Acholeplasmatales bacterium]|nr:hypothetical protein [Acholeplasmatales bacterium]
MPRVVKKVKKQRGAVKHTKKFWIILSSCITAFIAAVVATCLIVYFVVVDDDYDYFSAIDDSYSISYDTAKTKMDDVENLFIFYWDDASFDPEDNDTDALLEENIEKLYKKVLQYNELDASDVNNGTIDDQYQQIEFYLVYTGNSKGSGALGTVSTDDDGNETETANSVSGITSSNVLAYYYSGKYSEYAYGNSKETETYDYTMNDVKDAIRFVNNQYEALKEILG